MANATLVSMHRYPVKSMRGEQLEETRLTELGVLGDRAWAVRDEERGGIRGGKRFPALMSCTAHFLSEPSVENPSADARIELPDGRTIDTTDTRIDDVLSSAIGHRLSLWPLLPAEQLDHFRRGAPDEPDADLETQLRTVFARSPEEPLPDLSEFPEEVLAYACPPGTYFDAYPILILSRQSLATLQARSPAHAFDVRRFRPNLLVDSVDSGGFPEDAWQGRTISIGEAVLHVEMACPRCVMITHPLADLPQDPAIMRTVVAEHDGNLGVYASVTVPGRVRVGDALTVS